MEFFGQSYGGTNSTSEVYLSNRGIALGYTDFWLEQTFHHEFSSILLRNYGYLFSKKKWMSFNKDIEYGKGGVYALKDGTASIEFDYDLNELGVLTQYSKSSLEEDFNIFAQNLFLSDRGFWEVVALHERIKNKTALIIAFYKSINSSFTEEYFKNISKE